MIQCYPIHNCSISFMSLFFCAKGAYLFFHKLSCLFSPFLCQFGCIFCLAGCSAVAAFVSLCFKKSKTNRFLSLPPASLSKICVCILIMFSSFSPLHLLHHFLWHPLSLWSIIIQNVGLLTLSVTLSIWCLRSSSLLCFILLPSSLPVDRCGSSIIPPSPHHPSYLCFVFTVTVSIRF